MTRKTKIISISALVILLAATSPWWFLTFTGADTKGKISGVVVEKGSQTQLKGLPVAINKIKVNYWFMKGSKVIRSAESLTLKDYLKLNPSTKMLVPTEGMSIKIRYSKLFPGINTIIGFE